jgi:hypothetical protein
MNLERVATLLASGLSASSVASIIGVSPARISQLKAEEGFDQILQAKMAEVATKDAEEVSISAKYLEAEHKLLKQVIDLSTVSEMKDVTAALRVVAERQEKAKNRINPIQQGTQVFNTVVQLQLPTHAVPELAFSSNKEVIAIEDRNLAPLSSTAVADLFARMTPKEKENDPYASLDSPKTGNTETVSGSTNASLSSILAKARDFLSPKAAIASS